jgi:hypothetical protein
MTAPERSSPMSVLPAKRIATEFFRWWWNKPGSNTDDGFDEWAAGPGAPLLAPATPAPDVSDDAIMAAIKQAGIGDVHYHLVNNGRPTEIAKDFARALLNSRATPAAEIVDDLDRKFEALLYAGEEGNERVVAEVALRNFLWDNKAGIIAALRRSSAEIAASQTMRDILSAKLVTRTEALEAAEARLAQALANAEYWRLAAERRENRRERSGLDVAEAQTIEAPTPSVRVGQQQQRDERS